MTKRDILKMGCFFFICGCLFSCQQELDIFLESDHSSPSDGPPNIILILVDDIGYEVPSYTGGQSYQTPNIDFIAQNGIQFCEARATPLCSPSRVELMTGKYNFRNYVDWGMLPITNYTIGNLMKSAGYSTCIAGKWQLGGGDVSLKNFGFDKYMVWNAYDVSDTSGVAGSHYKNPVLYSEGKILLFNQNEYAEDIQRNYLFGFIDSSFANNKNFFALWTPNLSHSPFQPTPDDPEYLTAPPRTNTKFFSSMVKYLDKEIGMLLTHLDSLGISKNTYIIFTSDNGTDQKITSLWKGQRIAGGKGMPKYSWGTHVPFIVYKKNSIIPKVDSSIIDFSDILVTLSDMTGHRLPPGEIFDGVSFWPQIQGIANASARTWSFTDFQPQPITYPTDWNRWVEDHDYKCYDSSFFPEKKNQMFFIFSDSTELYSITNFTSEQAQKNLEFREILKSMKK